jgi:hypothetical protein
MLFDLLTAPVGLPVAGFKFILQQILDMAERELYDEDRIREELLLLQLRLDEREITEDEYAELEEGVLARLRAAREYRRAQAAAASEPANDESEATSAIVEVEVDYHES